MELPKYIIKSFKLKEVKEYGTNITYEEIEAIPIDFIIKTQEEYCKRYGEVYKAVVLNLVEDWRKENEKDNI